MGYKTIDGEWRIAFSLTMPINFPPKYHDVKELVEFP